MSELIYTLVSDGSSDATLRPILDWLLRENGVTCAIQGEWAELRRLPRPPRNLPSRLSTAFDLYPCDLLFIHRDAETAPHEFRRREINRAASAAFAEGRGPAWVCVIPVRMREAWLLFDEIAIRRSAGNPSGRIPLQLPALEDCEDLPFPKELLHDILRRGSGLGSRRRAQLRLAPMVRRITEHTRDFSPLRTLPAFASLENELRKAIASHRWDRR